MTARQSLIERTARWIAQNRNCEEINDWNYLINGATEGSIIGRDEQEYYDNMSDTAWKQFRNAVKKLAIEKYDNYLQMDLILGTSYTTFTP